METLRNRTPRFERWVDGELIPRLPGVVERWERFSGGAFLTGANQWIVRGIMVQSDRKGATLWAYVEPLFDDFLPLAQARSLGYSTKQGWVARTSDSLGEFAEGVAAKWGSGSGAAHLARCQDPAGLLDWIHEMYREERADPWSCGSVEACCYVILGDLEAAMKAATVPRLYEDEPFHQEELLAEIRLSIEAGPEVALARLQHIRDEQWQGHIKSVS